MATATDLAQKVRYVVQGLERTREITSALPTDLQKRSIGKSAFVFIESGINLLRRLNNAVAPTAASPRSDVKDILNLAKEDYEANFALLRDKMHAHRQDVPDLDALNAWTSMHDDYVEYFANEFGIAYAKIRLRDPALPKMKVAKPLPERVKKRISKVTATSDNYFNASKQGLFSSSGLSVMLGGASERGQEVIDAFDVLSLVLRINKAVGGVGEYSHLTAILYLVEAIAMFDALYDDQNPDPARREQSFLDELRGIQKPSNYTLDNWDFPVEALENAQTQINARSVRDRTLRNQLAAHVDPDIPLATLVTSLEAYNWHALWQAVEFSQQTFRQACEYGPIFLRTLARHGTPVPGVLQVVHSDSPPSYD
jgi:hypothetical protein